MMSCTPHPFAELQSRFLAILPRIEARARAYFCGITCPDRRRDRISEALALAWKWFVRLVKRGKDPTQFVSRLADFAVRAVKNGRRLAGKHRSKDVMNENAQEQFGFSVERLPQSTRRDFEGIYATVKGQQQMDAFEERLHDNTQTPVPDQAAFRIDFRAFLKMLSRRDRRLLRYLSLGHSGKAAARRFHLSEGRVTQLRQMWRDEWRNLHGDDSPRFLRFRRRRRRPARAGAA